MTASASLPMRRRADAAPMAPSPAAKSTARAAKPAAAAGDAKRASPRRAPPKTAGTVRTLSSRLASLSFASLLAAALIYGWQMRDEGHLAAVNKTAAFVFYERLFALWHVLHVPLFALLLFAAVIHVVAVHLY
jgi:hypothetical protein